MEAELEAAMAADAAAPNNSQTEGISTADAFEPEEQKNALLRLSLPPNGLDADGDLPVLELRTDQVRAVLCYITIGSARASATNFISLMSAAVGLMFHLMLK